MEFVFGIIILIVFGSMIYVIRDPIKNAMKAKDPYSTAWRPSRKTILKRKIEDANAELTEINEKEVKVETK